MSFKLAAPELAREIREGGAGYDEALNKNDAASSLRNEAHDFILCKWTLGSLGGLDSYEVRPNRDHASARGCHGVCGLPQRPNATQPGLRCIHIKMHQATRDALSQILQAGLDHAVAALFTEDAVQITPDGIFSGRESIEKRYADAFQHRHPTNHVLKFDQVYVTENNEVFDYGEWSGTFQAEGNPYEANGYWTAIVVREGNVWKTRMSTYNIATKPA